jgi:hypothetical protein
LRCLKSAVCTTITNAEPPNLVHLQTRAKPVAAVQRDWHRYCTAPEREFPVPITLQIVVDRRADYATAVLRQTFELFVRTIYRELDCATVVLVVGTSGSVYPAAGFVHTARQRSIRTVYVGPEAPMNADAFDEIVEGAATEVLPQLL